jgi:hypothetical protein
VPNQQDEQAAWLPVIGKSLAYLCLKQAEKAEPIKLASVLAKVEFLEALGLSRNDAAKAVGSSTDSVKTMASRKRTSKSRSKGRGTSKKARR